jgi:hypothetical protein
MGPQQRGQHRPRPAADVDHGPDPLPAAGERDPGVGRAVPGRAHEVVEGLGEVGMGGQVLP